MAKKSVKRKLREVASKAEARRKSDVSEEEADEEGPEEEEEDQEEEEEVEEEEAEEDEEEANPESENQNGSLNISPKKRRSRRQGRCSFSPKKRKRKVRGIFKTTTFVPLIILLSRLTFSPCG